jgi:hypothetical protein
MEFDINLKLTLLIYCYSFTIFIKSSKTRFQNIHYNENQHNSTQYNENQHNSTQYIENQHNDIQHNDRKMRH